MSTVQETEIANVAPNGRVTEYALRASFNVAGGKVRIASVSTRKKNAWKNINSRGRNLERTAMMSGWSVKTTIEEESGKYVLYFEVPMLAKVARTKLI